MTTRREFFALPDTSPASAQQVASLMAVRPEHLGRVLAEFRMLPSGVALAWVTGLAVLGGVLAGLDVGGVLPAGIGWTAAVVLWLCVLLTGILVVAGLRQRYRVCEHGLVTCASEATFQRPRWYAVPWSTIDPARMRLVSGAHLALRLRQAAHLRGSALGVAPVRQGLLAMRGLSFTGIDTTQLAGLQTPGGPEMSPYTWWMFGTARPERMLPAIERAMVADGYPGHGLAAYVAAQPPIVLRWDPARADPLPLRAATDPVLWRG